ncbi:hypothetical protein BJ684DRAFT_15552 [Piptocephalis cylindrospora]|uniref:Lung seven transmembrane receptor-domain-containing protein n=1 Tax=Piptocephalis cylindrospora TaxID=1907219 RepID=A0A4P9Y526_9FUNG|nr:hypothetical protein BJ684DRAFT_15552 [Piptocephalis cylindrospora]|eukprot:RKP14108.1 hypothetical protein BJ684DRAFT_15552 [Piptocephalis cylindrospora]
MRLLLFTIALLGILIQAKAEDASKGSLSMTFPDQSTYVIPAQTAFEYGSQGFARQGMLDVMTFSNTSGQVCNPVLNTSPNQAYFPNAVNNFTEVFVIVPWDGAVDAGCETFNDLARAAQNYAPSMSIIRAPTKFRTLVIAYTMSSDWAFGHPMYMDAYQGGVHGKDGPVPGVDVILINQKDYQGIAEAVEARKTIGMTQIIAGPGPWNAIFEHVLYRSYSLLVATVCVTLALRAIYNLVRVAMANHLVLDLRNAIFLLSLASLGCIIPTFLLRHQSYPTRTLVTLSDAFGTLALELLVYLWTDFLTRVHSKSWLTYVRHGIWLAMITSKITLIANLIYHTMEPTARSNADDLHLLLLSMFIANTVSMLVLGAVYIVCAYQFYNRRDSVRITPGTVRALTHLAVLALFAFISFLILSLCNVASITGLIKGPGQYAVYIITADLSLTFRGLCMLMILGIRLPEKNGSLGSGSNSYTGSNGAFSSEKDGRI